MLQSSIISVSPHLPQIHVGGGAFVSQLAWFSCGITSAVACKLAIESNPNTEIYYIEIKSAHPDNERFIKDCEKWYGQKINRIKSFKYSDQFDVIRKTRFINGPSGARCTKELKKNVRFDFENSLKPNLFNVDGSEFTHQIHGFEYKISEITRAIDYLMDFPYTNAKFPLIEKKLTKPNCAKMLIDAGISLPVMYILGYSNNNCIGCVKGGKGYWNKIRVDFPEVFWEMATLERIIGHSCINGCFLDELDPLDGFTPKPVLPSCSVVCEDIMPPQINLSKAKKVFYGQMSLNVSY